MKLFKKSLLLVVKTYKFTRDCGATTGFSPQLSILDKDDTFANESGNTFRSSKDFDMKWQSNNQLRVMYDKKSETYEKDKSVNWMKIEYVEK